MKFRELLDALQDEVVFETGILLVGEADPGEVRRQLCRWVGSKKIYQLRRGLYALAPPYRNRAPHPFVVANLMVRGSYVSCQSALAHHGLIPEFVPEITSVTTGRPGRWETPLGRFSYRHVKREFFAGFRSEPMAGNGQVFVATPEKALLDLVHLTPGADSPDYLRELRLDLGKLDGDRLDRLAAGYPKLVRAARFVRQAAREEEFEEV